MLENFVFCGRDRCAWCLGIFLGGLPGSLLAVGCFLRTSGVVPVDDIICRCHVYMLFCGGDGSEQTVSAVEEGILEFLEEESRLAVSSLSMPYRGHNISGLLVDVVRSYPSWIGDFRSRSSCCRRLLPALPIQLCFPPMRSFIGIFCCMECHFVAFLGERHSVTFGDQLLVLRNHMVAEFSPNVAISCRLFIIMRKCLGVNSCLVDFDHGIIDQCCVGEADVIFGVREEEKLDPFDRMNRHFHLLIPVHRMIQVEEGCIKLSQTGFSVQGMEPM